MPDNDRDTITQREAVLRALRQHGPCHPSVIAEALGISRFESRYHLEALKNTGEINYNFVKGYWCDE